MIFYRKLGRKGRLGNCLFQVAATVGHAARMGVDFKFPKWAYSHLIFPEHTQYNLDSLEIERYKDPYFHYSPIPKKDHLDLDGFFQSEKYFENVKKQIFEEFTKTRKNTLLPGCAVHVRRTDYLTSPVHHRVLPMEYYEEAMGIVKDEVYHIYSDDIEWCRANFDNRICVFHSPEGRDPLEDLLEMSQYWSIISANSSYSWWSSYLNLGLKHIITPKRWFKDTCIANMDTKDLIPSEWTIIDL